MHLNCIHVLIARIIYYRFFIQLKRLGKVCFNSVKAMVYKYKFAAWKKLITEKSLVEKDSCLINEGKSKSVSDEEGDHSLKYVLTFYIFDSDTKNITIYGRDSCSWISNSITLHKSVIFLKRSLFLHRWFDCSLHFIAGNFVAGNSIKHFCTRTAMCKAIEWAI